MPDVVQPSGSPTAAYVGTLHNQRLGPEAKQYSKPPLIWEGCSESEFAYIGAGEEFISMLQQRHQVEANECW